MHCSGSQRESEWELQRAIESHRETGREPVRDRENQIEPAGARVGVTESHREPERDRERQGESQQEPEKAR